ncbi:MAG: DNA-directed RNA polymerase subunit alpha [Candidatus Liptonbacteria bacterium]|nr:DNA-directed RNA polymerase subunit alpha [Candidatus Liptonbacteria bacterium]
MKYARLVETVSAKLISETDTEGIFEIEGLYTGYGLTVANAFRRVLLSSLPGAAITQVKIKGIGHEFTTIPNILEDVIEISLNLKKVRFAFHADEPQILALKVKGEKEVTAADIKGNAQVKIANPDAHIATLTAKDAELDVEVTVEKGLGYVMAERKSEKLPIGTIALDAFFSPVINVSHTIENMRIGEKTDYDKLTLKIKTDGTIAPSVALHKVGNILKDHFERISSIGSAAPSPVGQDATGGKEPKSKKKEKKEE